MTDALTITYARAYSVTVAPDAGRPLRFAEGGYPLFKAPDSREVAAPDDCLRFLLELHLSLCPVFDRRLRRWVERYFETIAALADENRDALVAPAGMDGEENAHRVWALGALRPLVIASADLPGGRVEAPVLLWTGTRLVAIRFAPGGPDPDGVETRVFAQTVLDGSQDEFVATLGPDVARFWKGLSAPRHPFAKGPLSGLSSGLSGGGGGGALSGLRRG